MNEKVHSRHFSKRRAYLRCSDLRIAARRGGRSSGQERTHFTVRKGSWPRRYRVVEL